MRLISVIVAVMLVLAACQKQPEQAKTAMGETEIAESVASWEAVLSAATVRDKRLAWDEFFIGMPLMEVREVVAETLAIDRSTPAGCGEYFVHLTRRGASVSLQFADTTNSSKLQSIFIRFDEGKQEHKEQMIAALHEAIDTLTYYPGVHDPRPTEQEDPTPQYMLEQSPLQAALLKPDTGLHLSLKECLD
jgi:hypothetical protein